MTVPLPSETSGTRERAARGLIVALAWGGMQAVVAIFYQAGVAYGAHPHTYAYIWWYDWTFIAAGPLVIGAVVVWFLLARGRLR